MTKAPDLERGVASGTGIVGPPNHWDQKADRRGAPGGRDVFQVIPSEVCVRRLRRT